jgi:hypothetical protein
MRQCYPAFEAFWQGTALAVAFIGQDYRPDAVGVTIAADAHSEEEP